MSKKAVKQKIEDVIGHVLDGDTLKNALDLVSYMRENKMTPTNTSNNGWKISSKSCVVCYISLDVDTKILRINPFIGAYESASLPDDLKEIVLSKKKQGTPCEICHVISDSGYNCSYKLKTIFDKNYVDACARSISFENPDVDELKCIIELLKMRKDTIKNGKLLPNAPTNYV